MKKISLVILVVYGLASLALVWLCVWTILQGHWDVSLIFGTIIWLAFFFMWLLRYLRREKKDDTD